MMKQTIVVLTLAMAFTGQAHAHGGGLDKLGCHSEQDGTYHCHAGDHKGQSFISKEHAQMFLGAKAEEPEIDFSEIEFKRSHWRHWVDDDRDCQDARQEVLIVESVIPVTFRDGEECKVESGRWEDPFTGKTFTDPGDLDIDHMVPLKEAHVSGGAIWDRDKKRSYANDLDLDIGLIAVSLSANRSKGAKDPANWLPPNEAFHCEYVAQWRAVKEKWELLMDADEVAAIEAVESGCR